jgi:DNA-binding transcriptional regulator YiaG
MNTPRQIQMIRKLLGETQAQFATRMGVDQATVSKWESGRLRMSGPAIILFEQLAEKIKRKSA